MRLAAVLKPYRTQIIVAALPSVLMLLLYYSLAIHMRQSLGRWPESIGERGFTPALLRHANITQAYFMALIWFGIFVWPLELLICVAHPRLRQFLFFLAVLVVWFVVSCLAMALLVPRAFFYWWMD